MGLLRNTGTWLRAIFGGTRGPAKFQRSVFKGHQPCQLDDRWMKRIVELADGKSIEEISRILYLEELGSGAGLADLGLWQSTFYQEVTRVLQDMSDGGYVRLVSSMEFEGQHQCSQS
jgi:hypothetical protein